MAGVRAAVGTGGEGNGGDVALERRRRFGFCSIVSAAVDDDNDDVDGAGRLSLWSFAIFVVTTQQQLHCFDGEHDESRSLRCLERMVNAVTRGSACCIRLSLICVKWA